MFHLYRMTTLSSVSASVMVFISETHTRTHTHTHTCVGWERLKWGGDEQKAELVSGRGFDTKDVFQKRKVGEAQRRERNDGAKRLPGHRGGGGGGEEEAKSEGKLPHSYTHTHTHTTREPPLHSKDHLWLEMDERCVCVCMCVQNIFCFNSCAS